MEPTEAFKTAFGKFVEAAQKVIDADWERMGYTHNRSPFLVVEYKNRFVAVYRRDRNNDGVVSPSGSIHCFVDMVGGKVMDVLGKVGDIYKPASFKAPARHARGNIFSDDFGVSCMGPYGPAYLK